MGKLKTCKFCSECTELNNLKREKASLQGALDTAMQENHYAFHSVIPELKDENAALKAKIAKAAKGPMTLSEVLLADTYLEEIASKETEIATLRKKVKPT